MASTDVTGRRGIGFAVGWTLVATAVIAWRGVPFHAILAAAWRATWEAAQWPGIAVFGRHWIEVTGAAFAGAVLWLGCHAAGRLSLGWIRGDAALPPAVRTGARVLAGLALVATAATGLGLAGLLYPAVEWSVAVILAGSACAGAARLHPSRWQAPVAGRGILALGVSLAAVLLLLSAVPENTEDALAYHVAAPGWFRALHRITDAPHMQYRWPLLVEQILSLLGGVVGPHTLNAVVFAAIVCLMWGWLRRRSGDEAAAAGGVILLASGGISIYVPWFKPDLPAAGFAFLGYLAWEAGRDAPRRRGGAWLLCGVALGWAVAAKQSTAVFGGGILLAAVAARAGLGWFVLLSFAGALAAAGPLVARTWWLTGNPAFPFGFGGTGWDAAYGNYIFERLWLRPEHAATPWAVAGTVLGHVTREFPLLLVGLPLCLRRPGARRPGAWAPWLVAISSGVVWAAVWPDVRYMAPALLLLCGPAAEGLAAALAGAGRWRSPGTAALAGIAWLGFVPTLALVQSAGPVPKPVLPCALGLEPPAAFHARTLGSYWRAGEFLARAARQGDRVLVVGDVRSAYLGAGCPAIAQDATDRDCLAAIVRRSRTVTEIGARIRQIGVTHVALNQVASMRNATYRRLMGQGLTIDQIRLWAAWWTASVDEVFCDLRLDEQNGRWVVYRITPHSPVPPRPIQYLPGTEEYVDPDMRASNSFQIELLTGVVAAAPTVLCFHQRLAELLAQEGRWRETLPHVREVMTGRCVYEGAYLNLGTVLHQLHRDREALAVYRAAADLYPGNEVFRRAKAAGSAQRSPARMP
ncbi:MAG: hypothetical protein AAB152_07970 [Candidatus Coatesbacteria bacterium]